MARGDFGRFLARVTACHVVTYFVAGVLAYWLFDYEAMFASDAWSAYMRPADSAWVAAGPVVQLVRGGMFAVALYPFRSVFLRAPPGWLRLWSLLVVLAILSTAGPAPGSVEGLVYTRIPARAQILALRETLIQTLAFAVLLVAWYRRPGRSWGVTMAVLTGLVILLSAAGTVQRLGAVQSAGLSLAPGTANISQTVIS